ncbi:hypothetical protein TNCV_3855371 [Trichonephila clavipes]|nr:hypothetical protein TNCV_3855371 [Trichonephila clavipes]
MSSDPNDFAVLTPGNFLIGRPLQSLPEPDMTDKLDNRLSQWKKINKVCSIYMVQMEPHSGKANHQRYATSAGRCQLTIKASRLGRQESD